MVLARLSEPLREVVDKRPFRIALDEVAGDVSFRHIPVDGLELGV